MNSLPLPTISNDHTWGPFRIAGTYLLIGVLWILFSDEAATRLAPSQEILTQISIYKGWGYVLVTSLLLYWLIQRHTAKLIGTERTLQESENKYQELLEQASDGIFIANPSGRYILVNKEASRLVGYTKEELLSMNLRDLVAPEDLEATPLRLDELREGKVLITERKLLRKDESRIVCEISAKILPDGSFQSIVRDITERKVTEDALKRSEKRYRTLFDNMMNGFARCQLMYDEEGRPSDFIYLDVNRAFKKLTGLQDVIGRRVSDLIPGIYATNPELLEIYERVASTSRPEKFETYLPTLGTGTWLSISAYSSERGFFETVFEIVTERKLTEIELQQRNDDFRLINAINEAVIRGESMETIVKLLARELKQIFASDGSTIYMLNPDGRSLKMQQYLTSRETRQKIEGLIGSTIPLIEIPIQEGGFFHAVINAGHGIITNDPQEIQRWMEEFVETTFLLPAARGMVRKLIPQIYKLLNIRSTIVIPLISNGKTIGLMDISSSRLLTDNDLQRLERISGQLTAAVQRQQANEQIRRSEEFLKSVQNALTASIAILDEEGVIVQVNAAWRKFAEQNDYEHSAYGIGENYLEICDSAAGPNAEEAKSTAKAIRDVITGQRREATLEYPCDSPVEKRWFTLRITKFDDEDRLWVVLTHENTTERKQAEEALRQSENRYRTVVESQSEFIVRWTPDKKRTFVNEAYCRYFGITPEQALSTGFMPLVYAEDRPAVEEKTARMLSGDTRFETDIHRVVRADGSIGWQEWTDHAVYDEYGQLVEFQSVGRDITERKQAEDAEREQRALAEALRETAEILNSTLEYGEVLDHILTAAGHVVPHDAATIMLIKEGTAHVARLQGYDKKGDIAQVMEIELPLAETVNLRQMFESGRPMVVPDTHSFPGWKVLPTTAWMRSNVGAPILINGEVVGFILLDSATPGFFTPIHAERLEAFANQAGIAIQNARLLQQAQEEIAERKQAEKELRASEERFHQLANNIKEMFWITDAITGTDLYLSPAYESIWSRPAEVQYRNPQAFIESILPEDRPTVIQTLEIQRGGKNTEMEYRIMRPDGSVRWIWDRAFPIFDDTGRVIRLTGIAADITERKQVETALRERDMLLQESQKIARLGHYQLNILSGDWESSETLNEVFGIDWDYLTDVNGWLEIIHPAQREEMHAYFNVHVVEKRNAFNREYRIVRKSDGQERWVHGMGRLEFDTKGNPVRMIGTIQDITERRQAEEALRESEERFSNAFEFAPIGMALVSLDGHWLKVNHAICELLGFTEAELLNTTFQNVTHPDDLNTDITYTRQMLAGEINTYQMEKRYIHRSGHIVWVGLSVSLIKDSQGNPKYFILQIQDITERKQAEAETRRHLAELEALYENGLAVGRLLDLHKIGGRIIETFARHLSWHHVAIRLLQPDSNKLELIAFNQPGLSDEERNNIELHFQSMISQVGQGLSGWVAQTGVPLRTGNVHAHSQYVDTHAGTLSGLYMPLKAGERIIGVVSVESDEADAFTLQDERLLATLASQAAVAFENARLYQTIQQERERFLELFENSPVATWLEDFSAVITWMDELRAQGITKLREYLEGDPDAYKTGMRLIRILDVNQAAVVMNGAQDKDELIDRVHDLMADNTPSQIMVNELELIWKGYTSFGFEMSSHKLDGSLMTGIMRIYIPTSNNKPDYARVIITSIDITDRVSIENQLRASEIHYRELADSITDIFFELDQNFCYSHWNRASELLIGVPASEAIGKTMREIFGVSDEQIRIENIFREVLEKQKPRTFETFFNINGLPRTFEINAYPSTRGVAVVAKDVTERKRSESLMQKRFELMEYSAERTLQELMQKTLDEISEWTHSAIGFFQFIQEDRLAPGMQIWSTNTFQHFRFSGMEEMHKPADQAGVWAEAIRLRQAVIHNDYASMSGKKGLPESHIPMVRELIVPIIRNEKIMAVIGVGNKPNEYTKDDLEITERFADYAWDIIERKQMVIELAEERNQLAKRVEERTADLSRANSNLARALRVKDEFLANMSHELRTPLNAILGLSESLSEQIAGPLNDKQAKYINTISESGHHLLSLINDILDLAKIEAGQITLDINKVDVNTVCQASMRMVKQLAQKKNLEVLLEIDEKVGLMWADERRLKQMMVNLLSNAVKFTPEGGKIGLQIQGQQDENKVLVTVWDTGIGIKENDFQRLFQPFVQLDSGLARESTGTGLGLVLVAQMARMHGGSVTVSSDPGNGSRFTIVLPWEPALQMDVAERLKTTGKFRAIRAGQPQETILLIEDTQEVVMIVKDYLEIAGYKVVTAQDGLDGITQAKLSHPDLILMDIQMPRMDGLEATQRLRQDPEFKYTPIIALTALAMPSDRERCLAAGMDEYISKPVNLRGLVKIIQSCLSTREERPYPDEHHSDRR